MKIFGFSTSVICGILSAWLISDVFMYLFIPKALTIYLLVALPLSGFVTSFLLAKDALPPNLILKNGFFIDKGDTPSMRRVGAGMFSSSLFICLKTTYFFLIQPSHYGNNLLFIIGLYIILIASFFVIGFSLGGVSGNAGVYVRELFENKSIK